MISASRQATRHGNKGRLLPSIVLGLCMALCILLIVDAGPAETQTAIMQTQVPSPEFLQRVPGNATKSSAVDVGSEPQRTFTAFRLMSLAFGTSAVATVLKQRRHKRQTSGYVTLMIAMGMLVFAFSPDTSAHVVVNGVEQNITVGSAIKSALTKAVRSGTGGFLAGVCQVVAFMWLRTTMNYQYKNGGSFSTTLGILWAEGGLGRLYQGLFPWAILQAPLSRFGDTAANDLVVGLQAALFPSIPVALATGFGSFCGATWRVIITPIDTCKTTLQTDGAKGWQLLQEKVQKGGISVLWYGWEGNYIANVVGNYPFFFALNQLTALIPTVTGMWLGLMRHAFIGAVAATVSDVVSNSIRVMKTKKQTSNDPNMGYFRAAKDVIASDGLFGFMFRGLGTRIFTNVMQGAFFTVLWRGIFK